MVEDYDGRSQIELDYDPAPPVTTGCLSISILSVSTFRFRQKKVKERSANVFLNNSAAPGHLAPERSRSDEGTMPIHVDALPGEDVARDAKGGYKGLQEDRR